LAQHEAKGEGFGIVFLEAMAFGKPVIGPIDGAPKEIIQHGRHGLLVNPEDPSAVAEAIVDLLTNTDKACSMGQEASAWVRQHYSYGNFRENLRHLLGDADQIR
jgi:glycosyltransferase involved in cell wall biosynthesis